MHLCSYVYVYVYIGIYVCAYVSRLKACTMKSVWISWLSFASFFRGAGFSNTNSQVVAQVTNTIRNIAVWHPVLL